jgi:sarcosine oxidase subunit alpha
MNARFRTPQGGRIDRDTTYTFTFNDRELTGHRGDTLASALLAHGVHRVTASTKLGRPRGFTSAWAEDTGGLVQVEHPFPEPMLLATTVELFDGLVARGIPGQGRLAEIADTAKYDATHVHADVLVAGAGPSGLAAALTAARAGARVVLIDEQSEAGGALLGSTDTIDGQPATGWVADAVAELATYPDVLHLQRTTAFGHYDDGFILALQRRTDHLGAEAPAAVSRQRVWRIRARHVVVAAGAHERPVVFTDNDRPGIMLAHGARTFLHRYGVKVGEQAVVFTTNDSAYLAALDLHDAGVRINAIVDARTDVSPHLSEACAARGIALRAGAVITGTRGETRITDALVSGPAPADAPEPVACDVLLVSGGWNPAVHLFSQVRGMLRYDDALGAFVPGAQLDGVRVVGSANGVFDLPGCLRDGREAAAGAISGLGSPAPRTRYQASRSVVRSGRPGAVAGARPARCIAPVRRRATRRDGGRSGPRSGPHALDGTSSATPPSVPHTSGLGPRESSRRGSPRNCSASPCTSRRHDVPALYAGGVRRTRRAQPDGVRSGTRYRCTVASRGALFEDVGQWKRPLLPARRGHGNRRARDARPSVAGSVGGSTLGKIDVRVGRSESSTCSTRTVSVEGGDGPLLRDVRRRRRSTTAPCLAMTAFRPSPPRAGPRGFWTAGGLQTEWPSEVRLTSVTEQWHTFPSLTKSRDVVGAVFGNRRQQRLPFMAWRDTTHGFLGVGGSFFGGVVISVIGWYATAVWEKLIAAGEAYGITPYGTETMHVLRAEKGYPIIGQDTDGTITPHDLGMSWAVSKKKPDFIGKRSFTRSENLNPLRKQFVGLLPVDAETVLPEGAQIIEAAADGALPPAPVPMLGHVTSSYRSAELGRPFALALVKGGHARIGDTLHVPVDGTLVPVEVTASVLVDPEGARRDG